MDTNVQNLVIENATLLFRNFSGEETKFNREGQRNFCLKFEDPDLASDLKNAGWNIKHYTPRDDMDDGFDYLPVTVSFEYYPPKVVCCAQNGMVEYSEDLIGDLDDMDIEKCDVVIRPYSWSVNGKCGVKAYLKTMYFTPRMDEFEAKYRDIAKSSSNDRYVHQKFDKPF